MEVSRSAYLPFGIRPYRSPCGLSLVRSGLQLPLQAPGFSYGVPDLATSTLAARIASACKPLTLAMWFLALRLESAPSRSSSFSHVVPDCAASAIVPSCIYFSTLVLIQATMQRPLISRGIVEIVNGRAETAILRRTSEQPNPA